MKKTRYRQKEKNICLTVAMLLVVALLVASSSFAADQGTQYYKVMSTIEYSGNGQYRSEAETLMASQKEALSESENRHVITARDFDLVRKQADTTGQLEFVIDNNTNLISVGNKDLAVFESIHNSCVKALTTVSKDNVGKTWKQSFALPAVGTLIPGDLNFTVSATNIKTKVLGKTFDEMIAVRAISDTFVVNVAMNEGGTGPAKSKISTVYLFDPDFKDVYMSISVYESKTNINGTKEIMRHELATYKTNAAGMPVALTDLGKDFENFTRKIGLSSKPIKIVNEVSKLPAWARNESISAAQIANIAAALVCEGASNPVSIVAIPSVQTMGLQGRNMLPPTGTVGTVSGALADSVPAMGTLNIAAGPTILGMEAGTAGLVGAGVGGGIAAGNSGGSSSSP